MSRDWKPYELYIVDRCQDYDLRNSDIKWFVNGEEMKPSEELILKRELLKEICPDLQFLLNEVANILTPTLLQIDNVKFLLKQVNNAIKDEGDNICYGQNDDPSIVHKQLDYYRELIEKKDIEKNGLHGLSVMEISKAWFYGALDSNFYYREQNNAKFLEYLNDEFTFYKKWETEKVDVDVAIDLSGYADLLPDDR